MASVALLVVLFLIIFLLLMLVVGLGVRADMTAAREKLTQLNDSLDQLEGQGDRIGYPVFYINLDRSTERRRFMEEQFEKHGVDYTRVSAIDGAELNLERGEIQSPLVGNISYINRHNLSHPELGCVLSHLTTVKYCYDQGYEAVVVMEDDISLNLMSFWDKNVSELVQKLPSDWKIFQLYHLCEYRDDPHIFRSLVKDGGCTSCGAYLINRAGMKKLLDNCFRDNTFYIEGYFSGVADIFIYHCVRDVYIQELPLFYTYNAPGKMISQIHTLHTPSTIIRSLGLIKAWLNRKK
jgi:GR25 family glycosyltransferase involved in LPS biosynthesis